MRIVESFENWYPQAELNESFQAAKAFMQAYYAKRKRKDPATLTPEERDEALENPTYQQILKMVKGSPNYAGAFVRFHFGHNASLEDLDNLLTTLQTKKHLVSQLPKQIDQYATQEPENGIEGFERLTDALRTLERDRDAKWIVDRLPKKLRDEYRELPVERQKVLLDAAHNLKELGDNIISDIFIKVKSFESWPIDDVIDYITKKIHSYNNAKMSKMLADVERLEPEASTIYSDGQYVAVSVRTEAAQKELFSIADWCLNTGSFGTYVSDAVQLNIVDFNRDPTDVMYITGTTIYYTGKVRTSHDRRDTPIKKSDDPGQHLIGLGYPESVVRAILAEMPREMMIKKVVYDLKLDKLQPLQVLTQIITQSYLIDPSSNPETLAIVLDIVNNRLIANLTTDQIVKMYTDYGVMTKFSAMVMQNVLADATPEQLTKIKDATVSIFAEVNAIAKADPSLVFDQVKNILAQEHDVMRALGISRAELNEAINERYYGASAPARENPQPITKPRVDPATRPAAPSKPSPIPSKQPFKTPEPAKAQAEDVIKRLDTLTHEEL